MPRTERPRRPRRRAVLGTLAVVALLLAAPIVWVQASGSAEEHLIAEVRPEPVALVLGAGLRPDGSPSTYLRLRLNAAIDLYNSGKVDVLLVSGDRSGESYDEPAAMRTWLLDHGVPDARIVTDDAGFDTHDSCVRAREVYGVTDAVVISQDYHLPRALFLCERAGISVQGVGVSSATQEWWKSKYYRVREIPASLKAAWDGLTHREPVGGMDPSDAVASALTQARSEK